MPEETQEKNGATRAIDASQVPGFDPAQGRKVYRVILESFDTKVETPQSFAIKFAILAKVPVTKINHLCKSIPSTIWTGQKRTKALNLLSMIKEVGGNGRIVEDVLYGDDSLGRPAGGTSSKAVCRACGFPLKKGDDYCSFCMTAVNPSELPKPPVWERSKKFYIPPKRLFFYFAILIGGIILEALSRL